MCFNTFELVLDKMKNDQAKNIVHNQFKPIVLFFVTEIGDAWQVVADFLVDDFSRRIKEVKESARRRSSHGAGRSRFSRLRREQALNCCRMCGRLKRSVTLFEDDGTVVVVFFNEIGCNFPFCELIDRHRVHLLGSKYVNYGLSKKFLSFVENNIDILNLRNYFRSFNEGIFV
nr:P17 protein [Jasmine virus A-1]